VGGWGGGIPAILHPGEFVMRERAVDALGTSFLAALNRAPHFALGGSVGGATGSRTVIVNQTLNVSAVDGQSVATWFRKNRGHMASAIRHAVADGGL
jgi:hypothetical protein